jgi:CubicO group peptidase (beta-lactamase class C family)
MDSDNLQQAWQAHSSQTHVTVDADLLRKEVQRNQQSFRAMISRRDVIEIAIALLLLPLWFYLGVTFSQPWTWYLSVPVLVWIAGFTLVFRIRHAQQPPQPDEPLLDCAQRSLKEVDDQIWLLRNVFWWYLLPPSISLLAFFAHSSWLLTADYLDPLHHAYAFVRSLSLYCLFLLALYGFIYYLNGRAVRTWLQPRRQELLVLLASLGAESTADLAAIDSANSPDGTRKLKRSIIIAVSCLFTLGLIGLASGLFESIYHGPAQIEGPASAPLGKLVTDLRKEKNLVGLAAMVTVDGQVKAAAADGERKLGSGVPLEISDQWHLGGITKSITATMIARLVESGQMHWTDTIGEIFPDPQVHDDWKPVTLIELLTDTAGAPANFSLAVRFQWPAPGPLCTQARKAAVLNVLAQKPEYLPGTKYMYSNVGYCIAGAMAEKITGATWEDLVKREVFEPLGLTEAGFGPPNSPDETLPQPRGHRNVLLWKVAMDDQADNTPIMGPSATIHMTLRDLCTYANEHLRGELGQGKLLSAETYKLLHKPELDKYACGWVEKEPGAQGQPTMYWHNGTNTMWYALVAFIPENKMVIAVTSNDGDFKQAETAAWEIVRACVNRRAIKAAAQTLENVEP